MSMPACAAAAWRFAADSMAVPLALYPPGYSSGDPSPDDPAEPVLDVPVLEVPREPLEPLCETVSPEEPCPEPVPPAVPVDGVEFIMVIIPGWCAPRWSGYPPALSARARSSILGDQEPAVCEEDAWPIG